jgi:CubicO group peptidase (beta-lactamase class C family)
MHRGLASILLLAGVPACGHSVPMAAIPPSAASEPLALPEPEAHEAEALPAAPAADDSRCAAPPKVGVADPDFGPVRDHVAAVMRWTGVTSVAVAVARDGEILWEEGFGWADRRRRRRADEHTMYSLASISKPFTATAIMVLRERGQLALEQPLHELLPPPGLRAGAGELSQATVARVASHTAGLPLHYQFYYDDGARDVPPPEETLRHYAVLVSAPGEVFRYSNLGFGLLDQTIAHVSGRSYAEFMRTEVFEPLDLRHTFVDRPPRGAGVEAVRYDGSGEPIPRYGFDHPGASGLYSSVHDLVRFGMFHIGTPRPEQREILPAAAREQMWQPVAPAEEYGLGWGVGRLDAVARVSHTGGMPGVRTVLRLFPEQGLVVVVLANGDSIGNAHVDLAELVEHAVGLPARADSVCALPEGHALMGRWEGEVESYGGARPLQLDVHAHGEVLARVGDAAPALVRRVALKDGVLSGVFWGDLAPELGRGRQTPVQLELRLRDDRLDGGMSALVPWTAATTHFVTLRPKGQVAAR